ncbi:Ankyrin repeat protein [Rickettsiales bacterium Ac37b]|nr:Ankyrin repeat protein [Rickettsiales bacterium Ac37b]
MNKSQAIGLIKEKYPNFNEDNATENQYSIAFHAALNSFDSKMLEAVLSLIPASFARNIIHMHKDEAFRDAAEKGHLYIVNRLLELTPNDQQREHMIHHSDDVVFILAAEKAHYYIVDRLLELTPDDQQREHMIRAYNDTALRTIAKNKDIRSIQCILSFNPEFEPLILKYATDAKFKEEIINSRELTKTLREVIEKSPHLSITKIFAYMDAAKEMLPLVLVSKNFTNYFDETVPKEITKKILKDVVPGFNEKEMNNLVSAMKDVRDDEPNKEVSFVKKLAAERSKASQPSLHQ